MTRWQYKNQETDFYPLSDDDLNDLGNDGWEMVSYLRSGYSYHYVFKRPVAEPEPPPLVCSACDVVQKPGATRCADCLCEVLISG